MQRPDSTFAVGAGGAQAAARLGLRVLTILLVLSVLGGGLWSCPSLAGPEALPLAAPTVILGPAALPPTSTPTPTEVSPAPGDSTGGLSQALWSPDGTMLTIATASGVFLYDAVSFAQIRFISSDSVVTSLAYSPDGTALGAGTVGGAVQCWRVSDGESMLTIQEQAGAVNGVAFAPDGGAVAAGYADGVVRLWRITDGELIAALQGHAGPVSSVAFTADGSLLASGSHDGTVRLWQVSAKKLARVITAGGSQVNSVAFSLDGSTAAAGLGDGTVRLFRVQDGALLRALQGHQSLVSGVAFSPDGSLLASASADGNARLWRPADGVSLSTLPAQSGPLTSIAFAPNGATLGAAAANGKVKLWTLEGVGGTSPVSTAGAPVVEVTEAPPPVETVPPPGCVNDATYVGDVTVPDNSLFNPGDHFDKTWRIRNSGTCSWGAGYRLVFLSGNIMGAQNSVGVVLTDPGGSTDVTVAMQAPGNPGLYSGAWQMMNAGGKRFGQKYTVVIQVLPQGAPPPPPGPVDTPTNPPPPPQAVKVEISADQTTVQAGACTYLHASVEGVSAAWLDGNPVVGGSGEKQVCPCTSTTYTLKADLPGGGDMERHVAVQVTGKCAYDIQKFPTLDLKIVATSTSQYIIKKFPTLDFAKP